MRIRSLMTILTGLAIAACDSSSGDLVGPNGATGVVVGSVESESSFASSATAPSSAPAASLQGEARTVIIGEVQGGGTFQALAEAAVDAQGRYRLEGVPAGRAELLIRARSDAGTEVGSVILHDRIEAGMEHRAQPINARSTLHARVWTHQGGSSQAGQAMGSAELALFLDASADVAAAAAYSEAQVAAVAEATVKAQQAITAVLASEGHDMDAEARNALLLALAVQRDSDRHGGAGIESSQRSYLSAALNTFESAGVQAEAMATAYASATTALERSLAEADAAARLDIVKQALLLNLEARQRSAAAVQGSILGLRGAVLTALDGLEARVRASGSIVELRAALADERSQAEGRIVTAVIASLPGIGAGVAAEVEAELQAAVGKASLWVQLQGAGDAGAKVEAVQAFRAELEAAVAAFVDTLPSQVQGMVSAEAMIQLLMSLGAGPDCG